MPSTSKCEKCGRLGHTVERPTPAQAERITTRNPNAELFYFQLCDGCAK